MKSRTTPASASDMPKSTPPSRKSESQSRPSLPAEADARLDPGTIKQHLCRLRKGLLRINSTPSEEAVCTILGRTRLSATDVDDVFEGVGTWTVDDLPANDPSAVLLVPKEFAVKVAEFLLTLSVAP